MRRGTSEDPGRGAETRSGKSAVAAGGVADAGADSDCATDLLDSDTTTVPDGGGVSASASVGAAAASSAVDEGAGARCGVATGGVTVALVTHFDDTVTSARRETTE
jgi:hypothetical protein